MEGTKKKMMSIKEMLLSIRKDYRESLGRYERDVDRKREGSTLSIKTSSMKRMGKARESLRQKR